MTGHDDFAKGDKVYALGKGWTITEHVVVSNNGLPMLNLGLEDGSRKSSSEVSRERSDLVRAATAGVLHSLELGLKTIATTTAQVQEDQLALGRLLAENAPSEDVR